MSPPWPVCTCAAYTPLPETSGATMCATMTDGLQVLSKITTLREECLGGEHIATGESCYTVGLLYQASPPSYPYQCRHFAVHLRPSLNCALSLPATPDDHTGRAAPAAVCGCRGCSGYSVCTLLFHYSAAHLLLPLGRGRHEKGAAEYEPCKLHLPKGAGRRAPVNA